MNDRFQFRVWKGKENRMVYNVTHLNPLLLDERINPENKHNVPMQCTGLKDKNGKLIYEGDIVSIDDGELKGIAQRHDKFDEYYGCIEIKLICKHTTIYKPTVFTDSEIIGNIYENKELLNE